jgi:hypothetical protein
LISGSYRVVWGDGTITTNSATHTYSSPYTGNILVQSYDLTSITQLNFNGTLPIVSYNNRSLEIETSQLNLLDGLLYLSSGQNWLFCSGNISLLPSTLEYFQNFENILSGDTSNLPTTLETFAVTGSNTITGNISNLPITLTNLIVWGNNTLSGNINNVPSLLLTNFSILGQNTISGNISLMLAPNLDRLQVYGNNTIFGDLSGLSNTVTLIQIVGNNTISGNISTLPPNLTLLELGGNNTITGDIANMVNFVNSVFLSFTGQNTIYGNIQNLPSNIKNLIIDGNNIISGDLSLVHLNIEGLDIGGNNTISIFSDNSRIFTGLNNIAILGSGFNSTNINNLLTSYSNSTWIGNGRTLRLNGTSTPKYTNTSGYNTLLGLGVNITIN